MNPVLVRWNSLPPAAAASEILPCCGSHAWANALATKRPIPDESTLLETSATVWRSLPESAWQEAFNSHPRIGEKHAQTEATTKSLAWSAQEQKTATPDEATKQALTEANRRYEQKFDRIFIICATGKTSAEILAALESRMNNSPAVELREAAEQQCLITNTRLKRWLEQN